MKILVESQASRPLPKIRPGLETQTGVEIDCGYVRLAAAIAEVPYEIILAISLSELLKSETSISVS